MGLSLCQKLLCSTRFAPCLKTVELSLPFRFCGKSRVSQGTFSESQVSTLPRPDLPMFLSGTNPSPFVFLSFAELDYRNSYEIEYMEKIGPPLPVSSVPPQSGAGFPAPSFVMETQHEPPPVYKVSLGSQTSDQGPSGPTASWVHSEGERGWGRARGILSPLQMAFSWRE